MPRGSSKLDLKISPVGLSDLARDLKTADPLLLKELRTGIKKAAEPARRQVQQNATAVSNRIAAAVPPARVSFAKRGASVRIAVNAKKAPHARPIENKGKPGTFRHPLFGNRNRWIKQPAKPFFWAGIRQADPAISREMDRVIDEVTRKLKFK